MLTLSDGRSELWQWDTNRKLTVDADCSQVHFSNKVFGRSIDVNVADGVADIPDILLQTDMDLIAWAFVGTAEDGYTKISEVFKVNRRNKPADYVFTPTDQTTLGEILERLDDLEEIQSPDAIKNAVDDYLASNPIQVEEIDPTVPEWAKQPEKPNYTAEEVGALPADTVIPEIPAIPSKLPNPHPLTFTGAVEATYDGSAPLTVNVPEGGGGTGGGGSSAEWAKLHEETLAENVKYIELDIPNNATEIYCSGIVKASTELTGKPILLSAWATDNAYAAGDRGLRMTVHSGTEQEFVAHFSRVMDKVTGECYWGSYGTGSSQSYWGKLHNVAANKFYFASNYGAGIIPVESNISVYWR